MADCRHETNFSQRNWVLHPDHYSGNLRRSNQTNFNSLSLFLNYGNLSARIAARPPVLDGFTLRDAVGGAMLNYSASPTIRNCIFTNNVGDFGGAMRNSGASPLVVNCAFVNNSAVRAAGRVYCSQKAMPLSSTVCLPIMPPTFAAGHGVYSSDVHLINCTVVNNFAFASGGGLYCQSPPMKS